MGDRFATLGADALPVTLVFDDAAVLDDALRGLLEPGDEARHARR
jgi:tetraacyldisaccharide 4'-kinase